MTFSDDDLKRLKEDIDDAESNEFDLPLSVEDGKALLARLEAAEKLEGLVNVLHNILEENMEIDHSAWAKRKGCDICDKLEAWRKAAGK